MSKKIALISLALLAAAGSAHAQPIGQPGQMGPNQAGPGSMMSGQMGPGQTPPRTMAPGQMGPGPMTPGMASMPTRDYIAAAAKSDRFEIGEAKLALTRSRNAKVLKFARMMIHDHMQSTRMIKSTLMKSGMAAPPPPMLDPAQTSMMGDLRGMSGAAFDKAYIDQQVTAHQKALQTHQAYAEGGGDTALRQTAGMIVPVVQKHLAMAQTLQSRMGG